MTEDITSLNDTQLERERVRHAYRLSSLDAMVQRHLQCMKNIEEEQLKRALEKAIEPK